MGVTLSVPDTQPSSLSLLYSGALEPPEPRRVVREERPKARPARVDVPEITVRPAPGAGEHLIVSLDSESGTDH